MVLLFRCTAGGNQGWGNLKRLELIFNFLKKNINFDYKFLINKNKDVENYLKIKKIKYISIDNNLKNEKKILKKFKNVDISILELLHCNLNIQKIYKKISSKLIILDDITKKRYISDILISCQRKNFIPKKNVSCKFYNDFSYFPLKSSFNKFISRKKKTKKVINKVTVFLGGSDYSKLNTKIAEKLKDLKLDVTFLIGLENSLDTSKKIKGISNKFKVLINSTQIPKILFNSDLVISGGGYTKLETAFLKTPMICVPVHDHQKTLIRQFYKAFKIKIIYSRILFQENLKNEIQKLDYEKRLIIKKKFSKFFIENGINKIFKLINEKN